MADWNSLKEQISRQARQAGFDLCGVAPAGHFAELEYFPRWIAEGRHGEMNYLAARTADQRLKRESLANVAPWARSVVVSAINYDSPYPYSTECSDPSLGWISRYAWAETDYHDTVLERLRTLESSLTALATPERVPGTPQPLRTWCYVDTGPVVERVLARYAGIGWVGKNTCVINQQLGSWIFLGVLLTSLPLPPDLPAPDRCGSCTRCLDACPTGALPLPYQMDASRCIAYLTIEKRGSIPTGLRAGIGRNIFGCDICQDVCPWNRRAASAGDNSGKPSAELASTAIAELTPRKHFVNPELRRLAAMSEEEFRSTFRHSPVNRAKYEGLMRNVIVAMGNSGDPSFIPELEALAHSGNSVLTEHAQWSLGILRSAQKPATQVVRKV
ncbi:MAG: tRNA epoxyqueuosine(34) reductase QueG [Candidatus Korobacteraceae bacterium]|jgi:epoxyqueuosine reductase